MFLVPLPTHERFKKSDAQNCFHLFFCGTLERRLASTNFLRRFQTKTSFAQRNSFLGQSPTLSVATSCFKTLWMTSNKTRCAIFWLDLCGFVTSDIKVQLLTLFEENWKLNVFYVKSQQGSVALLTQLSWFDEFFLEILKQQSKKKLQLWPLGFDIFVEICNDYIFRLLTKWVKKIFLMLLTSILERFSNSSNDSTINY